MKKIYAIGIAGMILLVLTLPMAAAALCENNITPSSVREVDVVTRLEWGGPEGTRPDIYEEYMEDRVYEGKPAAPIPLTEEEILVHIYVLNDQPKSTEYEVIEGIPTKVGVYRFYLEDPRIAGSGVFEKVDSISLKKINESTYYGIKLVKKISETLCIGYPSTNYIDGKGCAGMDQSKEEVEVTVHYWKSTLPPIPSNSTEIESTETPITPSSVREVDVVTRLEWGGPEGTRPDLYEEYMEDRVYEGKAATPLDVLLTEEEEPIVRLPPRYIILVDNYDLMTNIYTELVRYKNDVIATGYDAEIWYYYSGSPAPESIRDWLQTQEPFVGCLLIGDLSSAWFELGSDSWPIDLFFMDLDGTWTDSDTDGLYDSHTGDVEPEIFVARLKADNLFLSGSTEVGLLKNYFDKNHKYRHYLITQPKRGLMYVDDDWVPWADDWNDALGFVYKPTTLVKDRDTTIDTDYENRLGQRYDWIQVCAHSWPGGHHFKNTAGWDGYTYNTEIKAIDPDAFFYNLFACSATRFTTNDYLGGWYIFTNTYGLTAIGSTKSGSMLEFDDFYRPIAQGNTIGNAFLQWFKEVGVTDISWFYGMNILGDPMLKPVSLSTRAVFRAGEWIIDYNMDGSVNKIDHYGSAGDVPLVGDFNNDGVMDRAVFRVGEWIIDYNMDGSVNKIEE
jgi:hypothetical protein